jgi:hypothetical protein
MFKTHVFDVEMFVTYVRDMIKNLFGRKEEEFEPDEGYMLAEVNPDDYIQHVEAVLEEAVDAANLWGDDFDELNTINDWVIYTMRYLGNATRMGNTYTEQRAHLVKAGGLILNALRVSYARYPAAGFEPRHYDEQ